MRKGRSRRRVFAVLTAGVLMGTVLAGMADATTGSLTLDSPSDGAVLNGGSVTVTWTSAVTPATSPMTVQASSPECTGTFVDVATTTADAGTAAISLADGTHCLRLRADDGVDGEVLSGTASITVDTGAPTIAGSATPAPNAAGWNNTDVTVSFLCDDGLGSGIATCTNDTVLSTDGADQSVSGTATDLAGNSAGALVDNIDIDKTAPTVTGTMGRAPDHPSGYYTSPVTVTFSGTDATSGVDTATCTSTAYSYPDSASAFAIGSCEDNADNVSVVAKGFKYDAEAPGATIDSNALFSLPPQFGGNFNTAFNGAPITGKAYDGAAGVSTVLVVFTPLPFGSPIVRTATLAMPGSTSTTWSVATTGLTPGGYRIQATAIDAVGHVFPYTASRAQGYAIAGA